MTSPGDADIVYVNGDSCIPGAKPIEPMFKARMFASVTRLSKQFTGGMDLATTTANCPRLRQVGAPAFAC